MKYSFQISQYCIAYRIEFPVFIYRTQLLSLCVYACELLMLTQCAHHVQGQRDKDEYRQEMAYCLGTENTSHEWRSMVVLDPAGVCECNTLMII